MLKLEEQLRKQTINLDQERLEKIELRNKLIDMELHDTTSSHDERNTSDDDSDGDNIDSLVLPPAPGRHTGEIDEDEGPNEQDSDDDLNSDSESERGVSKESDSIRYAHARGDRIYAESDAGSRTTDAKSLLNDFDRYFKDLNANYPKMPRTSSRARTSDLALRFKKEADLIDERNSLKKLGRCEEKQWVQRTASEKQCANIASCYVGWSASDHDELPWNDPWRLQRRSLELFQVILKAYGRTSFGGELKAKAEKQGKVASKGSRCRKRKGEPAA